MIFWHEGKNLQWYSMTKRTENFGFRCVFVAKTPKMLWVKMWINN